MNGLSINRIWEALAALEREAERQSWTAKTSEEWEQQRYIKRTAAEALAEYRILSEAMPRLRSLSAEAGRSYDRYVTRYREDEGGCSCHISPPCSYCTRETEDEAA